MTLISLIFKSLVIDADNFKIVTPGVPIYICRFLTSLLMHMEMIEDVKQGISMLHYLLAHPDEFTEITIPFAICLLQFSGGILAELANLLMLSTRETIDSCINFFVAFHVLNAIDNIYVEAFGEFDLLEATH